MRVTTAPSGDLRLVELTQPRTVLRAADRSTPICGDQSLGAFGVLSCHGTNRGHVYVHA
jgi:hypothetical protein